MDALELYRWCDNIESQSGSIRIDFRYAICAENIFSGIAMPDECPRPLALVTFDSHMTDDKIQGQQMLYCLP